MMMPRLKIVSQVVGATLGGLLAGPVMAATFTVNTAADTVDANVGDGICADASGACSLRAAIQEANARPGMDTIILPAGTYLLTRVGGEEDLAFTGDLDITDPAGVTIQGAGAPITVVDGNQIDRVFHVVNGGYFDLSRVTVRNGMAGNQGGAIAITGSTAAGIASHGHLSEVTLTHSRASKGGCLSVDVGGAVVEVDKGSIYDCFASTDGGGVHNIGELTMLNTTVAGNQAKGYGGGIMNTGALNLTNVTVGQNTADMDQSNQGLGGGIANTETGNANIVNTIVAMNAQGGLAENCHNVGRLNSNHALESGTDCMFTSAGDQQNADPKFGQFGMQGGQTPVLPLLTDSPALDAANEDLCPRVDQRGFARTACDIGAYEAPLPADLQVTVNAAPGTINMQEQMVFTVSVHNVGPGVPPAARMTLQMPHQFGYVSGSAPGGCGADSGGTIVTCEMGVIAAHGNATATITAVGLGGGSGTATATVNADPIPDPIPANNSDSITVAVRSSGGGGGAFDWLMLAAGLPLLALRRRRG